jgi:pimeloyl-ACP methyl ester carboxylesterase
MKRSVRADTPRSLSLLLCAVLALCIVLLVACTGDDLPTTTVGGAVATASAATGQSTFPSQAPSATDYDEVTFVTEDDLTLSGRLYGEGTSAVVLSHMYPADQSSWSAVAEQLSSQGLSALTFDFRGYGESEGSKDIQHIDRDVTAAVEFLREAGVQQAVLVGASMGGTASLKAAIRFQELSSFRLAGVVTMSAPVEFRGLSAEEAVPQLVVPLLFVAAEQDVGASGAEALERLSSGNGELKIVAGSGHGTDLFSGPTSDQVWTLLLDFLQRNLSM